MIQNAKNYTIEPDLYWRPKSDLLMTTEIGSKSCLDIIFNIAKIFIFKGDITIFSEKWWNF